MAEFDANEYEYLDQTLDVIRKKLGDRSKSAEKNIGNLLEYNRYFWDNKSSMDLPEKVSYVLDTEAYADVTNNTLREIRALRSALDSPYFGRITFVSDDLSDDIEDIYIGLTSVMDGSKFYVIDWRSPIASLFYNSKFGEVSYKAPQGEVKGILSGRRQYKISNGKLKRIVDSELHLSDDSLQDALSRATTEKMKSIVNTIQEEQNEIVRNTKDRSIVVQGGAGSGKTAVALHRLAYLLYQDKDAKSNNMLIFSPNEVFSEYISGVLPELGEENVLQTTFSDFASSYLTCFDKLESFSEFLSRCYGENGLDEEKEKLTRFKFSKEFKDALDSYIKRMIPTFTIKDDVEIKNRSFNKEYLNYRMRSYGNIPINDKLNELTKDICAYLRLPYAEYGRSIKNTLKKYVTPSMNYRKFYNEFLSSPEFVEVFGKKDKLKNNAFLEYPDILGMLYMHMELFGYPKNNTVRHLAIDEAQDYSPLQMEMIKKIFSGATFTVLGDVNQTINPYFRYESLADLTNILGKDTKYYELNKSYRSSPEITGYSNEILGLDNVETARSSSDIPVVVKEVPKDALFTELVRDVTNMKENGFERVAIITKSDKEAKALYDGLKDDIEGLSVISDDGKHYSSTAVVPSYVAKGLEFDAVISYNDTDSPYDEQERYLYYVACTRAQHDLVIYNEPAMVKSKKIN